MGFLCLSCAREMNQLSKMRPLITDLREETLANGPRHIIVIEAGRWWPLDWLTQTAGRAPLTEIPTHVTLAVGKRGVAGIQKSCPTREYLLLCLNSHDSIDRSIALSINCHWAGHLWFVRARRIQWEIEGSSLRLCSYEDSSGRLSLFDSETIDTPRSPSASGECQITGDHN